ncbi:MAG TPA: hypothetical protein VGM72_09695 [Micropepsaceae bacterium]|jgi:hypothetical protein
MKRVAKVVFWIYAAFFPIGMIGLFVYGYCAMSASGFHSTPIPDSASGHVFPFVVGPRGGPARTIYVTRAYSLTAEIGWDLFLAWWIGTICMIAAGAAYRFRQRQISN